MTPNDAMERCATVLAHLWMVRTFLKHADEIQDDAELLDVPRTLFDSIRAVEPARERGDAAEFVRRLRGKLPKLRRVAELFAREHRRVSDHTNFQMAAASLSGGVRQLEEILAQVPLGTAAAPLAEDGLSPLLLLHDHLRRRVGQLVVHAPAARGHRPDHRRRDTAVAPAAVLARLPAAQHQGGDHQPGPDPFRPCHVSAILAFR